MTTFSEDIKERKLILDAARQTLAGETDVVINALEHRICELESDLENEQELTKKLKGLLDGGLVELVGELVDTVGYVLREYRQDCHELYPHIDFDKLDEIIKVESVLTKAKESMP